MRRAALLGTLLGTSLILACATPPPPVPYDAAAHAARVDEWRAWRHGELTRPDGWLSLAGLYWLQAGDNSFGSVDADLVYDRDGVPARLGTFAVDGEHARFRAAAGVEVRVDGELRSEIEAHLPDEGFEAPVMQWGSLQWYVMLRNEQLAVRLKDSEGPVLTSFTAMQNFTLDPAWWVSGRFEAYDPPRSIKVPNILGTIGDEESPGAAVFEIDGETYRIDLWRDSDDPANFFTAFGDSSNGDTTYGAGRFLWIDAPDERGRMVIDFNRSYNPPCAFTPFATCPLPPVQNRLPLRIEAGERTFKNAAASSPSAGP